MNEQPNLFGEPEAAHAHARMTDPRTSHDAAASVKRIRESQQYILGLFKRFGPMTDEQLAQKVAENPRDGLHLSPSGIRTRRHELEDLHLIADSGKFSLTKSNRKAIIWTAAVSARRGQP